MVTPTVYATSEPGRRYSRICPPYPPYSDRRFHLQSHHDARSLTMTEREPDESSTPRKRIAVACGRCRKRKIRCSGDPGNGGPCVNCKNAGYEPCLFLRVSSTETHLRDGGSDFGYNVETARAYHARGAVSPHNPVSQYAADMTAGDNMVYRQGAYPYGSKGVYYSAVSGWGGAYPDDSVDYSLNYSYPHLSQDPLHMVPGYGRYGSGSKAQTPVYVDSEASTYSYGNLVHRPAVNSDLPNFSLSGMAASLPTPTDRLPAVNRTLTGSSGYRPDGLPAHYSSSKASTSHSADVGYSGLNPNFESPVSYGTTATLPSNISARSSQSEAGTYHSASSASGDGIYASDHPGYRSVHESDSYIYSDRLDSSRRDSQSSGRASAGSVLSNGQVYVPESQSHTAVHGYAVSAAADAGAASQAGGGGATTAGGSGATSQVTGRDRRSAAGHLRSL
ncbi:hypothetical protein BJ170DRAFT_180627 [Xylariales sp. AK1849]|nr:hypothetical protein BJ170DRAFT_180627 [Xylariales sp. AK1849]